MHFLFHAQTCTPFAAIFERLRSILNEGAIDKRVQYMIEVMFAIRKDGFKVGLARWIRVTLSDMCRDLLGRTSPRCSLASIWLKRLSK